jgi:hypothetical protein
MNDTYTVGEFIRLNNQYSWGDGKFAGAVVQITDVHDHRELTGDPEALIYGAARLYPDSGMSVKGIPVLPSDIDAEYDHYEAQRAAQWNGFLGYVTA